jgi:hypothetical protein
MARNAPMPGARVSQRGCNLTRIAGRPKGLAAALVIVSGSKRYSAGVSRRARITVDCRGWLAACGAWVMRRCRVGVLARGGRAIAGIVVGARCVNRRVDHDAGALHSLQTSDPAAAAVRWGGSADVASLWRSGDGRQDPAPDSGPLRAHHRPGLIVVRATWQARRFRSTDTPTPRRAGPSDNTRPPRPRPFGPHTEHDSRLLTH